MAEAKMRGFAGKASLIEPEGRGPWGTFRRNADKVVYMTCQLAYHNQHVSGCHPVYLQPFSKTLSPLFSAWAKDNVPHPVCSPCPFCPLPREIDLFRSMTREGTASAAEC